MESRKIAQRLCHLKTRRRNGSLACAAGRPRCCGGESWNYPWRAALGNRKLPVVQNGPERPAVLHLGHYGICWGLGCGQGHEVAYGERCFGPAVYCKFRKYFLPRDVRSYRQSDEKTPS